MGGIKSDPGVARLCGCYVPDAPIASPRKGPRGRRGSKRYPTGSRTLSGRCWRTRREAGGTWNTEPYLNRGLHPRRPSAAASPGGTRAPACWKPTNRPPRSGPRTPLSSSSRSSHLRAADKGGEESEHVRYTDLCPNSATPAATSPRSLPRAGCGVQLDSNRKCQKPERGLRSAQVRDAKGHG